MLAERLLAYAWPGNVRELANACQYAVRVAGSKLHSVQRKVIVERLAGVRDLLGQPGAADRVAAMALELASGAAAAQATR